MPSPTFEDELSNKDNSSGMDTGRNQARFQGRHVLSSQFPGGYETPPLEIFESFSHSRQARCSSISVRLFPRREMAKSDLDPDVRISLFAPIGSPGPC